MDFLDVCEEPSIQNNLVFSQKEKAIRENWQAAVAACTGNDIQTQAKKMRAQEGNQYKKIKKNPTISYTKWIRERGMEDGCLPQTLSSSETQDLKKKKKS